MNVKVSDKVKVDAEILAITSAAGSTSLNYDMKDYRQALIAVNVQGNYSTATVDLMESSAATVAGSSAAASKAGMVVGGASTLVPVTGGVREMTLTITTASTGADTIQISAGSDAKTFTYSASTANLNSSAWTSTALYFGSTVGTTAATGLQLAMDSLKTAVNSTVGFGTAIICSTGTTASLTLKARDGVVGSLGFHTTLAAYTAEINEAVAAFDIAAEQLDSTASKRYISAKVSTISTAGQAAVTVIRTGGRYMPGTFSGKLSS